MTEEEAKLAAVRFANDMCKATRAATIEECVQAVERIYDDAERERVEAGADAGTASYPLHAKHVLANAIKSIRSLHHSHPGLEREE